MNKSKTIIDQSFVKTETDSLLQDVLSKIHSKRSRGIFSCDKIIAVNNYSPIDRFEIFHFASSLIE